MMPERNSQSGVMLIEALIGILIFSIGILALIGMQAAAIKNTTDARYRSEAAFLANQIISQMWVDRGNLATYDDAVGSYPPRDAWRANVEALLPGVNLAAATLVPSIAVVGANNNQVTVVLQWRQPGGDPADPPRRLQMNTWIN
jgi:type IV pilus assembly protein PilV